jgi:hypothetical protein
LSGCRTASVLLSKGGVGAVGLGVTVCVCVGGGGQALDATLAEAARLDREVTKLMGSV